MENHLNRVLVIPRYKTNTGKFTPPEKFLEVDHLDFYCLECKHKLKVKKCEDLNIWTKCPTCGFKFLEERRYFIDDLEEDNSD